MSKTISQLKDALKNREVTARSLVESALKRLKEVQVEYNVAISVVEDRALQRADQIDEARKKGEKLGRLAGIPFIAKDNFLTYGSKTTAASKILESFEAPYQSTAIQKLEAEGAIVIAKANLDAFAHGSSTENSYFGPTKNPNDPARVPGGSSGGSGAAVALDIVPFALGTDTGGSIRLPASYCGVVGYKPTYGLVSRSGVVAMASSTDTIGPLANIAEDAALVIDIMAGKDERDSTTLPERPDSFLPADNPISQKLKVGVIKEYMSEGVAPDVRKQINQQIEQLKELGHEVEEVSLPAVSLGLAVYYIVVPAEISSNLSRYDGIRYGHSALGAKNLEEVFNLTRDQGFMAENKRRILIGTYVLSSGYYDAYYRKAQIARTILIEEFKKAFEEFDVLVGPVAPTTAFKLGENAGDPLQMYLADIMTVSASLAGLPAISIPAGLGDDNMPIGLQIIGNLKSDALLFSLANQLEELGRG
ncbi:MAG: Asp-tRNA(Asn)/Glu-tRNA(Gln) amidotransferase subunit GatA [Candidatus Woesebacteria bacterium]|jgi:aspartyl-tRNA(Asn)/glutamyl-tRNA(Gln) amidotransferase subunit A